MLNIQQNYLTNKNLVKEARMKKHIFIIMIILCLAVMAACTSDDNGKDILNPYFIGEVIELSLIHI